MAMMFELTHPQVVMLRELIEYALTGRPMRIHPTVAALMRETDYRLAFANGFPQFNRPAEPQTEPDPCPPITDTVRTQYCSQPVANPSEPSGIAPGTATLSESL